MVRGLITQRVEVVTIESFLWVGKNNYFIKLADLPAVEDNNLIPNMLRKNIKDRGRQYVENKFKHKKLFKI